MLGVSPLKSVRDVDVNASKIASNPLGSSPRISSNTAAGLNTCTDIHVFIVKKYNKDGNSTGLRLLTRESSQVSMDK